MRTLKDKVAVVTGAGSGIGRSIALALAESGTSVVVTDIDESTAEFVAAEVRDRGVAGLAVGCDVSVLPDVQNLADVAYKEFGRVEILCNNAGVSWRPYRSVLDATLDDWRFILGINLYGVIHGLDVFLRRMRQQGGDKHIVNTASLSGLAPMEGHAPYSASKAAVISLSEAMAGELAPHGFGITILCAGQVATNLGSNTQRIRGGVTERFEPVETTMMNRTSHMYAPPVEQVGQMVREAILRNLLYVQTATVPGDLVADRLHTWFGSQTLVSFDDHSGPRCTAAPASPEAHN